MQETKTNSRRILNRAGFALALMMVLWQTVPTAILAALNAVAPEIASAQLTQALMTTVVCYLLAGVPAWLVLRTASAPVKAPEKHDLTLGEFIAYAAASVGAMFVFNLVGNGLNALVSLIKGGESANVVNSLLSFDLPVLALMVVVCAPLAEEFIFRGLFWRYTGALGKRAYVVLSAAAFMLLHGNIVQYPYTFALGLLFAIVYAKTGRLVYPIALHVIVNGIGGIAASVAMNNLLAASALGWTYIGCTAAAIVLLLRRRELFTLGGDGEKQPAQSAPEDSGTEESAARPAEDARPERAEDLARIALRTPGVIAAVTASLVCAALIIIFL